MLGQTISHYRITDKLGAGGMGVVYKAVDLKLERMVALKFLPNEIAVRREDKERLLHEARSASALDHPNIGVIYGLEESQDGQLFIVMAYYEGETLAQKLGRGLLSVHESLDLAIQLAKGLSAAHARNIVHRDIKPSNVIITRDGIAKIVDFGLARVVATASATQSISTTGTLPYMAPEQILGETVDQRSDIWALGVTLVQMLTGSHPFLRPNTAAMTFAILNQPPTALDAVPPLVQPILYHALSKKPANRYAGGGEMLKDLEAARVEITSTPVPLEEPTLTRSVSSRELKQYVENASTPRWTTAPQQKPRRLLLASLGVALAAAAVLSLPPVRERLAGLVYAGSDKHIAVLPFDNLGNDPANEQVAEGLMDSLTGELSNLDAAQQSLWVVPSSVVRSRKITDPSAAFRELGANIVVKGSIQRDGQAVHLTVNLIDAKRMRQMGAATFEDRAGDLATLQDEAVFKLARLMNIKVSAAMLHGTGGSVVPAAYESYLKALGYIQRYDKPGNLDAAISALNTAVQTDRNFAIGYAELGEAYRLKNQVDPNPKWIDEATANCNRAAQIDQRLPAVYVTLGNLHSKLGKDDLALQEFQRALALDPHDASALRGIASAFERMGRLQDAEGTFKKSAALRPDYWDGYNSLGLFYYRHNRYADAIAQLQHVVELTPDNAPAYSNIAAVYLDMGDNKVLPQAEQALKKSLALGPNFASYANLGNLYLGETRYAESAAMTEKALQLNDQDYRIWANLLEAYRWLKRKDQANQAAEKIQGILEEAVKTQPQDGQAQSALALCYAEKKIRDKATQRIETALALAPDDPHILADAGEVYEDLGDRRQALRYLRMSLSKGTAIDDLKSRSQLQGALSDPSFRNNGK
jgi:serine/threonine protein kinase/tetratricopeptide (TPR) repeat protein